MSYAVCWFLGANILRESAGDLIGNVKLADFGTWKQVEVRGVNCVYF